MISKNESPVDVLLEKTPSGTWKVPNLRRFTFRPWQRLWLAAGILYLLMLSGTYYLLAPSHESIERRMVGAVIEEVHRFDGMAFAGESPRNIFENARRQGYSAWIAQVRSTHHIGSEGNLGFDRIEKQYQEQLSDLPVQQVVGIMICAVAWLLPMGLLYALGFVVDWIKRGARGSLR